MPRSQFLDLKSLPHELDELLQAVLAEPEAVLVVVFSHEVQPSVGNLSEGYTAVGRFAEIVLVQEEPELPLGLLLVCTEPVELTGDGRGVLPLALLPVQAWLAAPHGFSLLRDFLAH